MNAHLAAHRAALDKLDAEIPLVEALAADCIASIKAGGKILLFGNGGSAADAQHWAAELTGRYKRERIALPAIALTTDTSALTAIGNDYNFGTVFSRQVQALARPGDVLIGISTSGRSANVLNGLFDGISARATLALVTNENVGGDGWLHHVIRAPGDSTATIQEMHGIIGHILCGLIEDAFAE
jgi:D-sedoheptulose 7-phosphate isomerase